MSDTPVFRHSFRTFGEAIGLNLRTIKTMEANGAIRDQRFGSSKRPIVRLEEPADFLARSARLTGPAPAELEPAE